MNYPARRRSWALASAVGQLLALQYSCRVASHAFSRWDTDMRFLLMKAHEICLPHPGKRYDLLKVVGTLVRSWLCEGYRLTKLKMKVKLY